jgi:hypothetical protein
MLHDWQSIPDTILINHFTYLLTSEDVKCTFEHINILRVTALSLSARFFDTLRLVYALSKAYQHLKTVHTRTMSN